MKHVKLFENYINEGIWVDPGKDISEEKLEEILEFLDEVGIHYDCGLAGNQIEINYRVTDSQIAKIRAKYPDIAKQIDGE